MSYNVRLEPSGHKFVVEEGKSVLKAGLDAGMLLPYSCRAGGCKTCMGKVLEGSVDLSGMIPGVLSEEDRRSGQALLCVAKPLSDLVIRIDELEGVQSIKPLKLPCRVIGMEKAAPDVVILTLRIPMNYNLFFLPGQYVEILLEDGQRRSYSLAVAPEHESLTQLKLHIRHTPGGRFTDHVFGNMKLNDMLRIEGPFGTFYLRENSDKPIVLLAGGTGFAPIKSIVETALQKGSRRPMHLYWGGRTRQDIYMMDLAQSWAQQHPQIHFNPVLSMATPACDWQGRTGYVHEAVMSDLPDLSGHQVYACGTPLMVNAARRDFVERCGLPATEFFADSFV
jgi:CDP-4-dehydro-6-deoxyglucose reductase